MTEVVESSLHHLKMFGAWEHGLKDERFPNSAGRRTVVACLRDSDATVRRPAASVLSYIAADKDNGARSALVVCIQDGDVEVRRLAQT